ncbi:hypothetical protein E2562_023109 [Oryza meyeriana var. granulata]|uniref:Uncharacterized protein n=1 Tax=Oryza meyeriana var. granulata TaxID=110450 RepID=A0A6G1E058_9ORYZ|nr:hypothetical protein E2562_023109 [Oryza meyeriana var. granulata]
MATSMQREVEIWEKAMAEEDSHQKLQNEAVLELQKLGLTAKTSIYELLTAFYALHLDLLPKLCNEELCKARS